MIAGAGAVVAIVALALALEGRSQNQSQQEIASQVKAEIETQIQGVGDSLTSDAKDAVSAQEELQKELDKAAKQRKRLSKDQSATQETLNQQAGEIQTVTKMAKNQKQLIDDLQIQVSDLSSEVSKLQKQVNKLESQG